MSPRTLPVLAAPAPFAHEASTGGDTFDLIVTADGDAFGLFMPEAFAVAVESSGIVRQAPPDVTSFWADAPPIRSRTADLSGFRAWVHDQMRACVLCEYRCGTDRTAAVLDRRTVCRVGETSVVQRVVTLAGEEPEISPAGSVFYSGCNMKCTHCHSWEFSHAISGTVETPASIARRVLAGSPRTLQFVGGNPDHHLLNAVDVIAAIRDELGDAMLPVVWNTNFYMTPEVVTRLAALVDVWVIDMKWWDDGCARRAGKVPSVIDGAGCDRRYRQVMERNLALLPADARILVRHVAVPGHEACCTTPIRSWAAASPRLATPGARYHEPPYLDLGPSA